MSYGENAALAAAEAALRAQQDEFESNTNFLQIGPLYTNEKVIVRFCHDPRLPSPFVVYYHKVPRAQGKGDERVQCLQDLDVACPMCALAGVRGEKRVKGRMPSVAWWLFSTRVVYLEQLPNQNWPKRHTVHLDEQGRAYFWQKAMSAGGQGSFQYHPNGIHPGQTHGAPWEFEGFRFWIGSLHMRANNGARIQSLTRDIAAMCRCGQTVGASYQAQPAKVQPAGWSCSECGAPIGAFDPSVAPHTTCISCRVQMTPDEKVTCTAGCRSPRRARLTDCYVEIKRTGNGKETSYDFKALPFSEADPSHILQPQADGKFPVPTLKEVFQVDPEAILRLLAERRLLPNNPSQAGGFGGAPQGATGWGSPQSTGGGWGGQQQPQQQGGGWGGPQQQPQQQLGGGWGGQPQGAFGGAPQGGPPAGGFGATPQAPATSGWGPPPPAGLPSPPPASGPAAPPGAPPPVASPHGPPPAFVPGAPPPPAAAPGGPPPAVVPGGPLFWNQRG